MNDTDKLQLLIVDDEQIVLDSIRKHLRNMEELELHAMLSAEEALKFVEENHADIILTDLMMPDIDGLELIRMVKDKDPNILMIMITGYATINSALQAMQLGAFDYIAKPFTREELKKIVRRAVDLVKVARNTNKNVAEAESDGPANMKGIGQYTWMMQQEDGNVLIGVERAFLISLGRIQTLYLPSEGDELRQGSTYFQAFSNDLRSQSLLSPLSGIVTEVNKNVIKDPNSILQDPYGMGWLIKLKPTNFEEERKVIGV